jgi:hypothetical protein
METCCPLLTVVTEGVMVAGLGRGPELFETDVYVVVCVVGWMMVCVCVSVEVMNWVKVVSTVVAMVVVNLAVVVSVWIAVLVWEGITT